VLAPCGCGEAAHLWERCEQEEHHEREDFRERRARDEALPRARQRGGRQYAVSTEDRTIDPDLERFMAKRMQATTIEVKASHLSLISHPQEITDLILRAAGRT
jgi:hypothetical protein